MNKKTYIGVPSDCTPIEYIQSTGTQWINTGIYGKTTTKVQLKINMTATTGNVIFGFYAGSDQTDFRLFNYQSKAYLDLPSDTSSSQGNRIIGPSNSFKANTLYELEIGNFYIKDLTTGSNIVSGTAITFNDTAATLTIWNYNNSAFSNGKLYYLKIYEGDILVRDFIPIKDSNNVACLFDKVSGEKFYNAGMGTFTAGNATGETLSIAKEAKKMYIGVNNIARKVRKVYVGDPNGVAKRVYPNGIDYLDNSAKTQYINTTIKSQYGIKVQMTMAWDEAGGCPYGTHYNHYHHSFLLSGANKWQAVIFGSVYTSNTVAEINKVYNVEFYIGNGSQYLKVNGTNVITATKTASGTSQSNIFLFTRNGSNPTSALCKMKLYSCKMYLNDTLVRDFVPALNANNVPCLWDKVSQSYFTSSGSGAFTYG